MKIRSYTDALGGPQKPWEFQTKEIFRSELLAQKVPGAPHEVEGVKVYSLLFEDESTWDAYLGFSYSHQGAQNAQEELKERGEEKREEEKPALPSSSQVGGTHYLNLKIQPIEYILANKISFCEGNIIKYVTRYTRKGGIEDLKKAEHFLAFLINDLEKKSKNLT